jgi:hypothetical protein
VSGASRTAGAALILWDCHGRDNQVFNWTQGSLLQARHSGMCVSVESASTAGGARLVQASCQAGAAHQSFTRQ